jgi:molybdopterin-guanine dinucleotide biosynthesis protein B
MKVFGLAGWSGSGKTTLILKLLPEIVRRGLSVATIKHTHHYVDVLRDEPAARAYRDAGAREVGVYGRERFAIDSRYNGQAEPPLESLQGLVGGVDLLLVEGFKSYPHPKLEIHRVATEKDLLYPGDPRIVAIATDRVLDPPHPQVFGLDDVTGIVDMILVHARPPGR